ncbi:MAG: helix-turn-helix domain-containing protein [Actinomycetota bacterium]|nr:helix-turn-helix domain-containing protein [Actinomycetota bacterium]
MSREQSSLGGACDAGAHLGYPLSAEVFVLTADAAHARLSRLLTVPELADLLQVPTKTIYTWRYNGVGPPAVPMGRYLRFRTEDVVAWLEERADDVTPERSGRRGFGTRPRRFQNTHEDAR